MISLGEPVSFSEALEYARSRKILPTRLSSAELRELEAAFRRRSIFMARVANAGVLQGLGSEVEELLQGRTNIATAMARMQDRLDAEGYTPERGFPGDEGAGIPPAEPGTLRDISSNTRQKLALETNLRQVANFGYRQQGMEDLARWQFPCWELVRIYEREVPRGQAVGSLGWEERWVRAGGTLVNSRMIARKDDPVWDQLGSSALFEDGLDNPYPPFAFNSGMGIREVPREECVALGVIEADEMPQIEDVELNEELTANAEQFDPEFLDAVISELDATIADRTIQLRNRAVSPVGLAVNRLQSVLDALGGEPLCNSRVYVRDHLGRFASDGGPLTPRDNIKRGSRAVAVAVRHERDVPDAMNVKGLGRVDFEWGRPGHTQPNANGKTHTDGYGLSHILAKHGETALRNLPVVLSRGRILRHEKHPDKRYVVFKKFRAVVQHRNATRSWVITNYDDTPK